MKTNKELIFSCKANDQDASVLSFIGSDATVDRAREIMTLTGWKTENYLKNPVFLWAHNYSYNPIGKAVRVAVGEKGLEFDIKFVPKEVDPFAEKIRQLYLGGFMNAVSVGFIPEKTSPNPDGTLAITDKELLELSAVPVPCNPNALQNAFQKGIIDGEDMKRLAPALAPEAPPIIDEKTKKAIQELYDALLFPVDKAKSSLSQQDLELLKQLKS